MEDSVKNIVRLIQKNLTDDLLKPRYRGQINYAGHCYAASECFYYLYGKDHGWKPYCNKTEEDSHWWLEKDGEILDITAKQFPNGYDYSAGHKQFFMRYPSKRCLELVRRVNAEKEMQVSLLYKPGRKCLGE